MKPTQRAPKRAQPDGPAVEQPTPEQREQQRHPERDRRMPSDGGLAAPGA